MTELEKRLKTAKITHFLLPLYLFIGLWGFLIYSLIVSIIKGHVVECLFVIILFGGMTACGIPRLLGRWRKLKECLEKNILIKGTVVSSEESCEDGFYITFTYTYNEQTYTATHVLTEGKKYKPGSPIKLLISPDNPGQPIPYQAISDPYWNNKA